jgi:hypothetical protein
MATLRRSNWLARRLMTATVVTPERAVARNKLVTNAAVNDLSSVRTPRVLSVLWDSREMIPRWLESLSEELVVKSAVSSVGRQVCVLRRQPGGAGAADVYVEPDGLAWSMADLEKRIARMPRPIFAEEVVRSHPQLGALSPHGTLCDLRLHFVGTELVVGRCRIPTRRSRGYGNVGRGALGVCFHPDGRLDVNHPFARMHAPPAVDGRRLDAMVLPFWAEVRSEARKVAALFESPHVGVDGTIAPDGRFTLIEVTLVPDTKWLSARGSLAFRDALRRAPPKQGRVEPWLATRPDLWHWVERRIPIETLEDAAAAAAAGVDLR